MDGVFVVIDKIGWSDFKGLLAKGVAYHSHTTNDGGVVVWCYDGGFVVCELSSTAEINDYTANYKPQEAPGPLQGTPKQTHTLQIQGSGTTPIYLSNGQAHDIALPSQGCIDLLYLNCNRRNYDVEIYHNNTSICKWDVAFLMTKADIDRIRQPPVYARGPGILSITGPISYREGSKITVTAKASIRIYGFLTYTE